MAKYKEYIKEDTLFIERFFDDPTISSLHSCIYDICMTVDETYTQENKATIAGGKFVVYHYEGRIQDIFCSVQGRSASGCPQAGISWISGTA